MLLLGFRASQHSHDYLDTLTWDYLDDNDFATDYFKEVPRFMVPLHLRHNACKNAEFKYEARIREFGNSIGDAFSQIGKSMKRPFERFSMNRPYERFQSNNLDQIELIEIQ